MKCPKCGTAKKLRPPEDRVPPSGPVGMAVGVSIGAGVAVAECATDDHRGDAIDPDDRCDRNGSWFSRIPLVKKLMLLVTGLWPVFWGLWSIVIAKSIYWDADHYENGMTNLRGNGMPHERAWSLCLNEGFFTGGIVATMIYLALMFVLFVVWFATKPELNSTAKQKAPLD